VIARVVRYLHTMNKTLFIEDTRLNFNLILFINPNPRLKIKLKTNIFTYQIRQTQPA
jgi:hypothetical protein